MQGRLLAGRYRLGDSIGSGGMGRVWRAHDEVLHRTVAIKELTAALYVSDSDRAVLLARTRAEARAAARINHSAVVTVHDVLEHDGRPWIVMELVEGRSLADAVKDEGRVEPREAARVGLWVLRALRAAHTAGVLHRDIKPGNVLLGHDGRVLLTDFGIAQIEGDSTITRTGEVVGSVDYLAPERIRGHDPGPASDLWALGATLYTAVEGRSPFRRTSPLSTMQAVVQEEPEPPRHAGPLEPVIGALLRKDPEQRPDSAAAEQMLAEAAEGRRPSAAQAYVATARYGAAGAGHGGGHAGPAGHPGPGAAAGTTATPYTTAAGMPYPTAVGPTAMPAHPAATAALRPRRRRRTLVALALLAALAGGGTAVLLHQWDADRGPGDGVSVSRDTMATAGVPEAGGAVPADWIRREDPAGFSLYLPKGWKREVFMTEGGLTQIDYTPDGGEHFLRVAVDTSPDFNDPYAHQLDLEQQLRRLADYRRVTLEKGLYRDRSSSRWEYTWTALAKDTSFPGPRRAVEETYMSRDGVEYALYMSGPAADWDTTRRQFRAVLQGWQERTG
ncbi:serine/threonine protein kinase [Streptomyces cyaneogriseus subsp. noncyanogenus]|uniref:non-specific serine/threonine protein kinase n=1 Tax=Streptomyces cyaneogriseus subsp. noncyanogenus TaxID=477245 RepID=A0A0C5G481_9ACTN|nr:serine/threonine-protein kinase [Streptomyces cyaneogriseus]AJP03400.1 serine/threonine protein kinase [Streptomyces cyaneogriseus subsp. noncyanogenus]